MAGDRGDLVRPELLPQPLENAVAGGHVAEPAVVVHAGDLRAVAGQDLRPAGLGVGGPGGHVDVDQRALADELLEVGQLAFLQQGLDVVAMGPVPADQDGIVGHRRLGASCAWRAEP